MRAIVVGGSGQIGGWLLRHLADRGHEAVGTYASVPFDGLERLGAADHDASAAWVRSKRPDVVFYPAGFTWVDGCEKDPARARAANCDDPLHLARAAAEVGARFVSFSTDYVFDGVRGPYSEDDPPNPLSVYGKAKREVEVAMAAELGEKVLILRTCWVFGPERQGKNFAYQLVRALHAGKALPCPSDQWSSPSYGPDVALAALRLAEEGKSGLWHVAGPETIARPDFARALADGFGLDPFGIVSKPTAELGQGAPRPLRGGLRNDRIERHFPGLMRPLSAAIPDFLARLDAREGWADPRA